MLLFLAMTIAAVVEGYGVFWGDGVPDVRSGVGVGVGNYRGGGTVTGAALRGLNYPVRLAAQQQQRQLSLIHI